MSALESLLTSITMVETNLTLVDNLIHNILIYELPEGHLIMNLRFSRSKDHDTRLIGGLTATIQEFAGPLETPKIRSIALDALNILFMPLKNFLIVFVVDPNYPDEQFSEAMDAFLSSFEACLKTQDYGETRDGAAIAIQTIHSLISEDIHMELKLGPKITIYPFKLRELADKTAQQILGFDESKKVSDLYDDTVTRQVSEGKSKPEDKRETLTKLLKQFRNTFDDISEVSLIRTKLDGTFEKFSESKLGETRSNQIYDIVFGMIDTVSLILESDYNDRIIDLDYRIILFHKVTEYSFFYIVLEDKSKLGLLEPIINRISKSIQDLLPDDDDI